MARRKAAHPTDAELEILGILWERGPVGLGQVYDGIREMRPVARTTVATMLGVMLEKGIVRRRAGADGYEWSASIGRDATARGMMGKMIDSVFGGSAMRMVAHLLEEGRLSSDQLAEIRRLLAEAETSKPKKKHQ